MTPYELALEWTRNMLSARRKLKTTIDPEKRASRERFIEVMKQKITQCVPSLTREEVKQLHLMLKGQADMAEIKGRINKAQWERSQARQTQDRADKKT